MNVVPHLPADRDSFDKLRAGYLLSFEDAPFTTHKQPCSPIQAPALPTWRQD